MGLKGEGFLIDRVSLNLNADLDFKAELKAVPENIQQLVKDGWHNFKSHTGDDLLKGLVDTLQIPFFSDFNKDTINLQLRPAFQTGTWTDFTEDVDQVINGAMDADVTAHFNTNGAATFDVFWDKSTGFGMNIPDVSKFNVGLNIDGLTFPDGLLTKLKQCFGVELLALGDTLTSLKLCPFQQSIIWEGSSLVAPESFDMSDLEPDSTLCFDIQKFETNMDKNPIAPDTAVIKGCSGGKCVETNGVTFSSGTKVEFSDGRQCMPVRKSSLEANGVVLRAIESNSIAGWNQYTAPLELKELPQECYGAEGCLRQHELPAPDQFCPYDLRSCYAKVTVSISLTDKHTRRLDSGEKASEQQLGRFLGGKEPYACTNYGVAAKFSGLRYGLDGFNVVDPVHVPSIANREPTCFSVEKSWWDKLVSAASRQTGMWLLLLPCVAQFLMQ